MACSTWMHSTWHFCPRQVELRMVKRSSGLNHRLTRRTAWQSVANGFLADVFCERRADVVFPPDIIMFA